MLRGKLWSTGCYLLDWIKITTFLSALCNTVAQQASQCFTGCVQRAVCTFCGHHPQSTQCKTLISLYSLPAEIHSAGNTVVFHSFKFNLTSKVSTFGKFLLLVILFISKLFYSVFPQLSWNLLHLPRTYGYKRMCCQRHSGLLQAERL